MNRATLALNESPWCCCMSRHANMSDYLPWTELYEDILNLHWKYLDADLGDQKLKDRKNLEYCLKNFLSVVSHDRKFFLPETGQVLRRTVCDLNEFTGQRAIIGFEAISQYASNLYTKPWRKEFRELKTYSGSYQHEVESNLLDADKLFLAMGYRRSAEDTFVLEGPICPDQVANVARDAMTAYVECQIMKRIYASLQSTGLNCTWKEIFHYRESHICNASQAIKDIGEKLMRREQKQQQQQHQDLINLENTYSNVTRNRCENCVTEKQTMLRGHGNSNRNACALHQSVPPTNLSCMYQQPSAALMTHSRSLEHYQEPHALLPHRHSFDQHPKDCSVQHQHSHSHPHPHLNPHLYEVPYDCLDGLSMGSTASYAAVTGGYNAPGNRIPLPYNISSQLNAQYDTPNDGYANADHNSSNMYASIGKPTTASAVPHSCGYYGTHVPVAPQSNRHSANVAAMQHRQSTYPPDDHLIAFNEHAQLMQHDFSDPRQYEPRYGQQASIPRIQSSKHGMNSGMYAQPSVYTGGNYDLPTTLPQPPQHLPDMCVYAQPMPKSSRIRAQREAAESSTLDRPQRHHDQLIDPLDNNRKATHKELRERISLTAGAIAAPVDAHYHHHQQHQHQRDRDLNISDTTTTSYESPSLDEFTFVNSASPPLNPKEQDGLGSYEAWNYVFKNLDNKDLGDRDDLLMQSLDLDALTLANGGHSPTAASVEKRRPEAHSQTVNVEKSRALEKKREVRAVHAPPPTPAPNSSIAGVKKVKSALKTATIDNRTTGSRVETHTGAIAKTSAGRNRKNSTGAVAKQPPPVSTQLIVTSPNEWSCRFCTFLNPDTTRVCAMCSHSKDFNMEAAANVSQHASSTCV
ncbi:protein tamozhennic isoform X1 [Drosophila albomicans]|uniref:Protein tamozhennic isoform X1 n=2 Tax=Drosophila albomicans TaxID=7291 RepID=A0A6P8XB53_DROAB|nr:protein tamozhennic isoform X1 [Drosophila albomicans]